MNSSSYWAASHITAFFKIADLSEDLLYKGSLGAGFNIKRGVISEVKISDKNTHQIFFNSKPQLKDSAGITHSVLCQIQEFISNDLPNLDIHHIFEVPIGAGYGTSASAALSSAFAINDLLNLQIPDLTLWQIAHKAEIQNKTGLGDILGLYAKSKFEFRIKEGAPGIGEVLPLNFDSEMYDLYTYSVGPLSKKFILSDEVKRKQITENGEKCIKKFKSNLNFENFNSISLDFMKSINLLPIELQEIIDSIPLTIKCSQIMLGESLFFFVPKSENISKFVNVSISKEDLVNETLKKLL